MMTFQKAERFVMPGGGIAPSKTLDGSRDIEDGVSILIPPVELDE